jgi:hypothetical protein
VVMVVVVVNDLLLLSSVTIEIPCLYINSNALLYCQFSCRMLYSLACQKVPLM